MCKKCNNTGSIVTIYRDGHEDIDLCDCEYNPYKQLQLKDKMIELMAKRLAHREGTTSECEIEIYTEQALAELRGE